MVVVHVSVQAKDGIATKFEHVLRGVVDDARKTAGCAKYEWYRIPDRPQQYVAYGEFDTKENFKNYLKSAVVQRIGAELMPLLATPPTFKHYEATLLEEGG
jgi:quinol monooxygenase YgiN